VRLGFILGEVWAGLKSNVSMVVSIILVTFISLTFVGVAALLQLQIGQMKNYWYDRAQVAIYLCTDFSPSTSCPLGAATAAQKNAVSTQLGSNVLAPYIDSFYFESHEEAYQKFLEEFSGSAVASFITAEQLNEAYWVNLVDPEQSALITETFSGLGGVEEVRDQRGYLDQIFAFLNVGSLTAAGIAGVMLISATLLISTTIKLSAFSRRREIGIMRLVGSSNFSIQLPFILEGIAAALAGSLLAVGAMFAITEYLVADFLAARLPFTSFVGFSEALLVTPYLVGGGVILAALASGAAIRRYLKI
jgi:cell division transport system permease protein